MQQGCIHEFCNYSFPDRMLGLPKTFSNDTLDMSSVDSMSLDEHIEIKIPEARVRENRQLAQNNFIQHINEKSRNASHTHLTVENSQELLPKNHIEKSLETKEGHQGYQGHQGKDHHGKDHHVKEGHHLHRSHSHASMKKAHGLTPNGVGHIVNGHHHDYEHSKIKK